MANSIYILLGLSLNINLLFSNEWITHYEQSGFLETPRYQETVDYCKKLAAASPQAYYATFGKSPQGRDLPLLIIDSDGITEPGEARKAGKAVILLEACIHSGESDGKDAGLALFRDILIDNKFGGAPEHTTILFVPILSVDAHERFGPYNRINQNGPKEMGWRVNAQNLNLNRDFLKADSPEIQNLIRLFVKWLPDFFVDSHTTDGADYQYAITYGLEIRGNMDSGLTEWQKEKYLPFLEKNMELSGYPVFPYVAFRKWHDPRSGLRSWVAPPMLSQGYSAIQNRPGLLIETHMLKPYKTRVEATYWMMKHTIDYVNREYKTLQQLNNEADQYAASGDFRMKPLAVAFKTSEADSIFIDFKGVEYNIEKSDLTGGEWFRYSGEPKTFNIPFFNRQTPSEYAELPEAYLAPPEWREVIERMELHGIKIRRLKEPLRIKVRTYKFKNPEWRSSPYEGRHVMSNIEFDEITAEIEYPAGTALIDMNQRAARVIAHILEPNARDSYVFWGFFNAIFEQKEYSESYVMEEMARAMIEENPALLEELAEFKKENGGEPGPRQIINWFYSKTPYWDQKLNLYPIGKVFDRGFIEEMGR